MVQVLQSNRQKQPSFLQSIAGGLAEGASQAIPEYFKQQAQQKQMQEANAAYKQLTGHDLSGLPPEAQSKLAAQLLQGNQKTQEFAAKVQGNKKIIADLEEKRGLQPGTLSAYENDPKMAEQVSRPQKESKKTQASQPIDPEQLEIIKKVRSIPGYDDMDEVDQYRALTTAGVSKENADVEAKLTGSKLERQQKGFESAYKAQEDFINDTTKSYKAFETETKPRLLQMRNIKDEDLISPTAAVFLDTLGIPLGALEDPSSELYDKLSQDLLKGLPETYGSRILKVEVDNFLKTIPRLMNSADGRRMIASNMLKLGEMKEVYYNEMRKQQRDSLDNSKALPRDFQQRVFDQVKPQIDRINNQFVKLSEIKSVPPNTIPFFMPNGEVAFVPKEHVQWAETEGGGTRIW